MLHGDLAAALRHLRRNPAFASFAIAALALGIAAATAAFSLISAVTLAPLPYPDAARLWVPELRAAAPGRGAPESARFSYPELETFRGAAPAFDRSAAYLAMQLPLSGAGGPERVLAELVTPEYFAVLGTRPQRGRLFGTAAAAAAKGGYDAGAVVLSDRLWRRRFGADPAVLGRRIEILRQGYTVAGVLPPGFAGLADGAEIWLAMAALPAISGDPDALAGDDFNQLQVVARARPGASPGEVRDSVRRAGRAVAASRPGEVWGDAGAETLASWRRDPNLRRILSLLLAAAGAILLIACANVAGLQLARGAARRRELAIRGALGASRRRVVAQVLAESGILALGGGAAGLAAAYALLRALAGVAPRDVPSWGLSGADLENLLHAGIGPAVVAFAFAATLVATFLSGWVPALAASRGDAAGLLRQGGASLAGAHGHRRQLGSRALVTAQTAAAVTLLAAAGLLLGSLRALLEIDPGFHGRSVLALKVTSATLYDQDRAPLFHQRLLAAAAALPGVSSAALGSCVPFSCRWNTTVGSVDGTSLSPAAAPAVGAHLVSPGYFRTLGIPLLAGRELTAADRRGAPRVVIVSQSLARRLWPGQAALGHRVGKVAGLLDAEQAEVVGVAADARQRALAEPPAGDVYIADYQNGAAWGVLFVRTEGAPGALVPALRRALRGVDPDLPYVEAGTLGEQLWRASSRSRYATTGLSAIAAVALFLTLLGAYGVVAQAVGARRRELALRVALGADRRRLLDLVLRQGLLPVLAGLALGVPLAWAACRWLAALVYGAAGAGPAVWGGVPLLVVASAAIACLLPARRALHVDPALSLRHE